MPTVPNVGDPSKKSSVGDFEDVRVDPESGLLQGGLPYHEAPTVVIPHPSGDPTVGVELSAAGEPARRVAETGNEGVIEALEEGRRPFAYFTGSGEGVAIAFEKTPGDALSALAEEGVLLGRELADGEELGSGEHAVKINGTDFAFAKGEPMLNEPHPADISFETPKEFSRRAAKHLEEKGEIAPGNPALEEDFERLYGKGASGASGPERGDEAENEMELG